MPFSEVVTSPTWRSDAEEWIRDRVVAAGRTVTGEITQPRVRPWSTQLIVPTDAGLRWFKANCPALAFEPALHATLARLEPDEVDEPFAVDAERGWIVTWLDTVLELPWHERTEDNDDVVRAREILDADHHGLEEVKDRIVEYLAVRARRAERGLQVVGGRGSGAVILLAGPPGVGKTSLGESVAHALGRRFVRVAEIQAFSSEPLKD